MALSQPTWLIKSRPCPYYQQGRCLFGDSCNFVHPGSAAGTRHGISAGQQPMRSLSDPSTPAKPPLVTISSPRSVRSPTRSPRLSGLLLALRDVIGDDPEEEEEFMEGQGPEGLPSTNEQVDNLTNSSDLFSHDPLFEGDPILVNHEEEDEDIALCKPLTDDDSTDSGNWLSQDDSFTDEYIQDDLEEEEFFPSSLLTPSEQASISTDSDNWISHDTSQDDSVDEEVQQQLTTTEQSDTPTRSGGWFSHETPAILSTDSYIQDDPEEETEAAELHLNTVGKSDISSYSDNWFFRDTPHDSFIQEDGEEVVEVGPQFSTTEPVNNSTDSVNWFSHETPHVLPTSQNIQDDTEEEEVFGPCLTTITERPVPPSDSGNAPLHEPLSTDEYVQDDFEEVTNKAQSVQEHTFPLDDRDSALGDEASPSPLKGSSSFSSDPLITGLDEVNFGHQDHSNYHSNSLNPDNDRPLIRTIASSPDTGEPVTAPETLPDLLSPVDLSHLRLIPFVVDDEDGTGEDMQSFDSGFMDNWKTPYPLRMSPPRSPVMNSTFDLLASPFGSPSARIRSPRLGTFNNRSPSLTSSPISKSPQREGLVSAFDLDSPTDRYSIIAESVIEPTEINTARVQPKPLVADLSNPPPPHRVEVIEDKHSDELAQDTLGGTSAWEDKDGLTAVFLGSHPASQKIIERNLEPTSESPSIVVEKKCLDSPMSTEVDFVDDDDLDTPFTANLKVEEDEPTRSFVNTLIQADSETSLSPEAITGPLEDDDNDNTISSQDITAQLAYLRSPTVTRPAPTANDTLNSLYDTYSEFASPESISNSIRNSVNTPSPVNQRQGSAMSTPSSLRERVFTPPPVRRGRSGTITADSPTSLSSPITSLDSLSKGRASPFSAELSRQPSLTSSLNQSVDEQVVEVSKKVPFGFRNSFVLGRTNRSSLISGRASRSIPRSSTMHESTSHLSPKDAQCPTRSSTPPTSAAGRLKPLRLSTLINSNSSASFPISSRMSSHSSRNTNHNHQKGNIHRLSISSASVSSGISISNNPLLSSPCSALIPEHIRNTLIHRQNSSAPPSTDSFQHHESSSEPMSAPIPISTSWENPVNHEPEDMYHRSDSRLSEPQFRHDEEEEMINHEALDETIRRPLSTVPDSRHSVIPPLPEHLYFIATPKPTLMFAIASDDVEQVKQVLENGDVGPNDAVGPQSALMFAMTNNQLTHKMEIVKTLLAFGADPSVLRSPAKKATTLSQDANDKTHLQKSLLEEMDPATRYYVERADAQHTRRTSALIYRSSFRPLARVRYDLVGQDRALEQLFRVLNVHSRALSTTPIVVLLCGPSGHGKSLLARKFGALLDVPTHTVNMTTLRSTHDLWQSYSMSPYDTPTSCTLAEFLINNEGKRCVVVFDEIEKTQDEKTLVSLLMPWELGRCSFEAGSRHVDVSNVVWLGTSNIGHDLILKYRTVREDSEQLMSREEYVELMGLLRPLVSERLGASIVSRVTTVLPFTPFTTMEKKAICSEAMYTLGGDVVRTLSPKTVDSLITTALGSYIPSEGARSLYRAVSNQLVDII